MINLFRTTITIALVLFSILLAYPVAAVDPGDPAFEQTWQRVDLPVQDGEVVRTWTWGPDAFTFTQREPYAESPGGMRLVQYFDKGRMEITDPGGDSGSLWYVTSGLLVDEMIAGAIQLGDANFEAHSVAEINIAGDSGDYSDSPTYASLTDLTGSAGDATGQVIDSRLNRAGEVSIDASLASQGVVATYYDDVTGHNIADRFWQFMSADQLIYQDGVFATGPAYPNPFYLTGRPVAEAYWSNVPVAGVVKLVLSQCFERRCLTYTPDNPGGWQVEAGNVGQHYYEWRYGPLQGQIAFMHFGDVWAMNGNGTNPRQLTSSEQRDVQPRWSPDGSRVAFIRPFPFVPTPHAAYELWVVDDAQNAAEGNAYRLLELGGSHPYSSPSFDWSPDGSQIVASRGLGIFVIDSMTGEVIHHPTGLGFVFDLDWSPTGSTILFRHEPSGNSGDPGAGIFVLDAASGEVTQLTDQFDTSPAWSPDGTSFVVRGPDENVQARPLNILDADGSNRRVLAGTEGAQSPIWSPSGNLIAFHFDDQIWIVDFESPDSDPRPLDPQVTEFDFPRSLSWSPDSTAIAANIAYFARTLWVFDLSNGRHNLTATDAVDPDWAP